MRFQFIDQHRHEFPVATLCRALEVSASGYYAWRQRPASGREERTRWLGEIVRELFHEFRGVYGSPRIHQELVSRGVACCVNTVAALMRLMGLRSRVCRRFRPCTTRSDPAATPAANLLQRRFDPVRPNLVWAADITYVQTQSGWLYLAVVMDLCSRRVLGWATADHLRADLAVEALEMALATRAGVEVRGLIHHSDRGVQYTSSQYRHLLRQHGLIASMSRRGNCWDNAPVESFFGSLKSEQINHETYKDHAAARRAIFDYIERFYNRKRRHSAIGNVSPVEFERKFT